MLIFVTLTACPDVRSADFKVPCKAMSQLPARQPRRNVSRLRIQIGSYMYRSGHVIPASTHYINLLYCIDIYRHLQDEELKTGRLDFMGLRDVEGARKLMALGYAHAERNASRIEQHFGVVARQQPHCQ